MKKLSFLKKLSFFIGNKKNPSRSIAGGHFIYINPVADAPGSV